MIGLAKFERISVQPVRSIGTEEQILLFRNVTREKIWLPGTELKVSGQDSIRLSLLGAILSIYQSTMPWLGVYSVLAYIMILYQFIRYKKSLVLVIVLSSLLVLVSARVVLLSLIDVTSWQIGILSYLHPAHVVWLAFVFLTILESFSYFTAWLKNRLLLNRLANL